jgi:hypothetical protein
MMNAYFFALPVAIPMGINNGSCDIAYSKAKKFVSWKISGG